MADIDLDVSTRGNVMVVGQHPAVLASCELVERDKYVAPGSAATGEKELQVEWVFEAASPTDPENPEQITLWTYTSGKKVRELMASFFGRPLTEDEAKKISTTKLVGKIRGFVMVSGYTKRNGQPGVKFGGWVHNAPGFKQRPFPQPSDFFKDTVSAGAPTPKAVTDAPASDGGTEFEDPFEK
jgi:hypothetical protein